MLPSLPSLFPTSNTHLHPPDHITHLRSRSCKLPQSLSSLQKATAWYNKILGKEEANNTKEREKQGVGAQQVMKMPN